MSSECSDDTISLDGKMYDVALGDGLTDNELTEELEKLSDINAAPRVPKVASIIVIPDKTKTPRMDQSARPIKLNRNKTDSSKHKVAPPKGKTPVGPLPALFSKAAEKESKTSDIGAYKRIRSPGTQLAEENLRPQRHVKIASRAPRISMVESQSREETLKLKVCLVDSHPSGRDTKIIRSFLNDKIVVAMKNNKPLPIFKECTSRHDGVYLDCADYSSAEWRRDAIKPGIPELSHKLMVVPHDELVQANAKQTQVRVVTCLPTRQDSRFILEAMAKLNSNLSTERWRITSRRNKGAAKSTILMRMDKES